MAAIDSILACTPALDQSEYWPTAGRITSESVRIDELSAGHAVELLTELCDRAADLQYRYVMTYIDAMSGGIEWFSANLGMLKQIMYTDARRWLSETALGQALVARVAAELRPHAKAS